MDRVLDVLDNVLVEWLGAALVGAAAIIVFVQVFTRNVLGFTSIWAEEMPRYTIILAVCVALADAWRHQRHLRMTLVTSALPRGARRGSLEVTKRLVDPTGPLGAALEKAAEAKNIKGRPLPSPRGRRGERHDEPAGATD